MNPKTLKQETAYQGPLFRIRRDQVELGPSTVHSYEVVEHPGSVTIIPVDGEGSLWFVRQYRHPVGEVLLEFPAGTLEQGEDPLDCARREAQEEIGMRPDQLDLLGEIYLAPGYSSERSLLYLAQGLQPAPLTPDEDEDLALEKASLEQVYEWIANGELQDGKTLSALLLALPLLDRDD